MPRSDTSTRIKEYQLEDEPFIDGVVTCRPGGLRCENCHTHTNVIIRIKKVNLPAGIQPATSLIAYMPKPQTLDEIVPLQYLGITCGCYARFHRQICHINEMRARRLPK